MQIQTFDTKESKPALDIEISQVGYQICEPSHHFGPSVRSHYLFHYVKKGCGIFRYEDNEINVGADEIFLIYPDEVTYYEADAGTPWEYYWFGFSGKSSEALLRLMGFSRANRRVSYKLGAHFSIDSTIEELAQKKMLNPSDSIYETAKLYEIISWLAKSAEHEALDSTGEKNNALIKAAVEYIRRGYMLDIKIADIASHIGCDRTQLYRMFMQGMGQSPQQYLIETRMRQAARLAENTNLSVKQIAYSVGYQDQYLFSKMFKKTYGLSPKLYRERV
jgi:AraC family transcriptional regulator of arabinose operon